MLAQVDEYRKVYAAKKVVDDQAVAVYDGELRRRRTLRMERELTLAAPKWIVLASVLSLLFGAIAGHNSIGRAVVCDSFICKMFRIDGRVITK